MVEKSLIVIIAVVFLMTSWWWANQQDATEKFYKAQLNERDAVIEQLSILALPLVRGKTSETVQALFQNLYPRQELRHESGIIFSGGLGVHFSEDAVATGFFLPGDEIPATPSE